MGRRDYDGHVASDHDLLVRIDERLVSHLHAFTEFALSTTRDREGIRARLDALEDWRSEVAGAARANARTVAAIIAGSSALTAIAVWLLGHLVK